MYRSYKKPFIYLINQWGSHILKKRFDKPPIYIGGCGRSGTTLLLSILSSHQEIFACPGELNLFGAVSKTSDGQLIPTRLDRLHRTLLFNNIPASSRRYCEKSPNNINHIKEIEAFHQGNFRFLHIVRDGRDVILSRHPASPDRYWVSPQRWISDVKAGYQARNNPKVYTVRYEDLVLAYAEEIKKICGFLEIPLSPELLHWHNHAKVRNNRAYFGEVKNIFSSSIGKWKMEEDNPRLRELLDLDEANKLLAHYRYI